MLKSLLGFIIPERRPDAVLGNGGGGGRRRDSARASGYMPENTRTFRA